MRTAISLVLGLSVLAATSLRGAGGALLPPQRAVGDIRRGGEGGGAPGTGPRSTSPDEADGSTKAGGNTVDSRRVEEALAVMQREIDALKEHNAKLQRRLDAHDDALRRSKAGTHGDASVAECESESKRDDGRELAMATVSVSAFNQLKKTVQALSGRLACVSAKSGRGDLVFEGATSTFGTARGRPNPSTARAT
jgi:hypothetical protein